MAMLEVKDINVYYGAIHAIKGISLSVDEGEIVTLIGANGAGKSTTLRTISGLLKPKTGEIKFLGNNIHRKFLTNFIWNCSLCRSKRQSQLSKCRFIRFR